MANVIPGLLGILMLPLFILTLFGGIVAEIWLLCIGEWETACLGLAFFFVKRYLLSLFFLPTLLFAPLTIRNAERKNWSGTFLFGTLTQLVTHVGIIAWCIGIMLLFLWQSTTSSWLPCLILAYSISTGALSQAAAADAKRNPDTSLASTTTSFAMFAYIIVILFAIFSEISILSILIIFGCCMTISFLLGTAAFIGLIQKEKKFSHHA